MINITVNGTEHQTEERDLEALVLSLGLETTTVATAVNGQFVSRAQRSTRLIETGDRIEILSPQQGG